MKIPKQILESWKIQREFGDVGLISEHTGISRTTITNALNNGRMNENTFEAISNFYTDKRKKQKELIKKTLQ